jgi:hypothetical protein
MSRDETVLVYAQVYARLGKQSDRRSIGREEPLSRDRMPKGGASMKPEQPTPGLTHEELRRQLDAAIIKSLLVPECIIGLTTIHWRT